MHLRRKKSKLSKGTRSSVRWGEVALACSMPRIGGIRKKSAEKKSPFGAKKKLTEDENNNV